MQNSTVVIPDGLKFKCKLHGKDAGAFCTYEGCDERILCFKCVKEVHSHSEDSLENINELFISKKPLSDQNLTDKENFIHDFKSGNEAISSCYKEMQKELSWFEHLSTHVQANFSSLKFQDDWSNEVRTGLENLVAKSDDKKSLTDTPELSQLVGRFVKASAHKSTEDSKIKIIQNELMNLFGEVNNKLSQLSAELSKITEVKATKDTVIAQSMLSEFGKPGNNKVTNKPVTAVAPVIICEEEVAPPLTKPIPAKPGDAYQSLLGLEKLFLNKNQAHLHSKNITNTKEKVPQMSNPPTSVLQNKLPNLGASQKARMIELFQRRSQPTAVSQSHQMDIQEVIPLSKNLKPQVGQDYTSGKKNLQVEETHASRDMKTFFEGTGKVALSTFEDWYRKANKQKLDPKLISDLQHQNIIIEAFNKTKKQCDIINIIKDCERYFNRPQCQTSKTIHS